ncbi:MAG: right-handed parallel beta-helix repeat-containing protein [Caldimonas sp.]
MSTCRRIAAALAPVLVVLTLLVPAAASAQAVMWLSVNGDDTNPCSRPLACRTFTGVFSKLPVGGEVHCIDSGDFGLLQINKSMTVDCRAAPAVVRNSNGFNGVVISLPDASGGVAIRGLTIDGGNSTASGIRVVNATDVQIEDVTIRRQGASGILVANTANTWLTVVNVVSRENGQHGVLVAPSAGAVAYVSVSNSVLAANHLSGIRANDNAVVVVSDSVLTANYTHNAIAASAAQPTSLTLERVTSSYGLSGVQAIGAQATVYLSNVTTVGNLSSLQPAIGGARYVSFGNNRSAGNTAPGGTTTPLAQF